jgi:hypothetical protein
VLAFALIVLGLLARVDAAGIRTLSGAGPLIQGFRAVGRLMRHTAVLLTDTPIWILTLVALFSAAFGLFHRFRTTSDSDRRAVAAAIVFPALLASFLLVGAGMIVWALAAAFIAGVGLMISEAQGQLDPGFGSIIAVLGVGFLLRFYALAEVPNGYAEHSAVLHSTLSIPYFEGLSASIKNLTLQPFLGMAWTALMREQAGFIGLLAAVGFQLYGVSFTVTRLVPAALGFLTILVAYLVGREFHERALGVTFGLLLSVSPWHISISRYSSAEHVVAPLFLLLSLLFIQRSCRNGRPGNIVAAALCTALNLVVYATNLVVPVIAAIYLIYRAMTLPRGALSRALPKAAAGVALFAVLAYFPASQMLRGGLLSGNVRTGYQGYVPMLADSQRALNMLALEARQLLVQASDPWFAIGDPGIGILAAALFIPGLILLLRNLWNDIHPDLGFLMLVGLPISMVPAIFAPDQSFRRVLLTATLMVFVAAFAISRLAILAAAFLSSPAGLTAVGSVFAIAYMASGTFDYFDRVHVGEEVGNGWLRSLVTATAKAVDSGRTAVIVPARPHLKEVERYMLLADYALFRRVEPDRTLHEGLYIARSCEDASASTDTAIRFLVIAQALETAPAPCTPQFLASLSQTYPNAQHIVASPPVLPADLSPSPP